MSRPWKVAWSMLFLAPLAFPCLCTGHRGCAALGNKEYPVFIGTVLAVTDVPPTEVMDGLVRKARIRVDESFGGLASNTREVDVMTGYGNGDCGVPFKAGDVYLIDASAGKDGVISAAICSNTRKAAEAGAEIQVLRRRREGQTLPSLVGQIKRVVPDFKGRYTTEDPTPVADIVVRMRHGRNMYQSRSNGAGVFAFYNLPTGKYQMDADLPMGMTNSWNSDHAPPASLELSSGGCEQQGIDVFPSGSIQGRVLDSSAKPVRDAPVYIVPAGQPFSERLMGFDLKFQGREGFFKFIHLPPGEYVILVNPANLDDPAFPYPRTFAPGKHDRQSAGIIAVRAGEHVTNADIHVLRQFEPRPLTVRVTWADGRLIRDFVLLEVKQIGNPEATAATKQPELHKSIIQVLLVPGKSYEIQASLTCRYSYGQVLSTPGATLRSNSVTFDPSDGRSEISLTMPGNGCPEIPGRELLSDP